MKKNKKGILFIILLTICLICPLNTTVKAEQSNYLSVQETESVSFSNISFTNLTFKDKPKERVGGKEPYSKA